MNQNNVMVTVKDIGISFNNHQILKNLSFKLTTGSMTSLLGINGVGKTTLIKMLTGQLKPDTGTITYAQPHINIGYVPQFRNFDNDYPLSIRSFVALNLHHKLLPWLNKQEKQQLNDVLTATHLSNIQNNRLSEASGGEKQCAYLAQALISNPQLLILDEATASLDINAKIQLMNLVKQINQQTNLTVLFVTHDIKLARQYTQQYLMLHTNHHYEIASIKQLPHDLKLD